MIEFVISGPDAEGRARAAAEALTAGLGYRPTERRARAASIERGVFEAVTITLMIPPAVVATLDLVQRARMLTAVRRLLGEMPDAVVAQSGGRSVALDGQAARAVIDLAAGAAPTPVWDVFVSSAEADEAVAGGLAAALRGAGLRVFWRGDLMPGDVWTDALWNAQRTARATVALVSAAAQRGWWAREAVVRGLDLKRAWDHGVIPVYRDGLPEPGDAVPLGLRIIVSIDLPAVGAEGAARAIAGALARG